MRFHVAGTTVVIAGMAGGAVVGFWDGLFASVRAGVGALGVLSTVALVTAVDLLVGGLFASVGVLLYKLARWGRRTGAPAFATYAAWALCGLGAAGVAAATISGTAIRNNRFLAAGIVAALTVLVAAAGALISPAIAGLFGRAPRGSRRRSPGAWHEQLAPTPTGVLVLAPLCAVVLGGLIFLIVWRTRAPLTVSVRTTRTILAAIVAVLIPAALTLAATRGQRLNWRASAGVALVVLGIPALLFLRANWTRHFQFLPWKDGRVLLYVIAAGVVLLLFLRWRPPRRNARLAIVLLTPPLAAGLALWAGAAEPARKAATTEAGLAGAALALIRPALDFDKDTFPGLLGGGDCDDRNPAVNPGALDWPEDGLDQDCDGRDLRAVDLRPPPQHRVPATVPRDLNILLIVIDTLRADHLGSYGYKRPTSPEIDALAADGVVFENAWAHAPSTRYSMPALVTGRWPSAIKWEPPAAGATKWWPAFSREHRTIAEALRARGYFNGAFYAYEYFNRTDGRGFERGIDQYDDRLAAKHIDTNAGPAESRGSSAREMADDGIDFLRAYRDQKFFLTLHFYDPHLDYQRHPGAPEFGNSPADLYDGEIWFTDRNVGRVIGTLRELGLYDKTAIFITGDHGEGLGEHGIVAHGYDLLAPQTKVPLIARVPGLGSRRVQEPVGHVDLAPTLANLARAPAEPTFLGRSMLDLLGGTADDVPAPEYVFQEVSFPPEPPRFPRAVERRAIASASHHLLWNQVPENTIYCYDLVNDPGETRDLWGTRAGEPACIRLKTLLDRHLSLLKLSDLPHDFIARISASVTPPGSHAPGPPEARVATFGDMVRYLGYQAKLVGTPFPSQGPPIALGEGVAGFGDSRGPGNTEIIRVARGGEIELTSYFQVLKDLAGWRVFFHLDGPGGTWRNLDHVPAGGAYPVERWRAGQQIRDRFTLRFGADYPPGLHTLHIGFWKPPSSANRRLSVSPADVQDGQDRFRVLTFAVE
jgi:arylsulfatase A-like enzyme